MFVPSPVRMMLVGLEVWGVHFDALPICYRRQLRNSTVCIGDTYIRSQKPC